MTKCKILAAILAAVIALSSAALLSGCGGSNADGGNSSENSVDETE